MWVVLFFPYYEQMEIGPCASEDVTLDLQEGWNVNLDVQADTYVL